MKIKGLQKLTLLDFPGHTACTVFLPGCNFRCPFCHNASLVCDIDEDEIPEEEFFDFLEKRKGLLDGVCVTGGEPTLQPDLKQFIYKIKKMGYLVKLDTNGYNPTVLEDILENNLCDYVAMDIKSSPENYNKVSAVENFDFEKIRQSINLLKSHDIDYEFRTTVVEELHNEKDFESIGKLLSGEEKYFLQSFVDSGDCIESGYTAASKEMMINYLEIVKEYVPNTQIRGI
ncbi:MAG: anaerobic ribonucleoside-triphosphate reductase activating protein [Clostridia bacterium]|nr:anaerobic ribonucleoside-triphosphate reductase activating protein [Clostridia bacterium]